jgi:hypothetical protein
MSSGSSTSKTKTIGRAAETAQTARPAAAHQNQPQTIRGKENAAGSALQTKPQVQPKLKMGRVGDAHEQQADAMAEKVVKMTDAQVRAKGNPTPLAAGIQRKAKDDKDIKRQATDFISVASLQKKANDEKLKKSADEKLQKKMNDEKEVKKAADEKLQKKVNDEKLKKSADEKLQKKMNDEKELKKAADEKLQKKMNDEKEVKKAADEKLQKKMNDEKEVKKVADEKLQKKMNDEKLKKSADEKLQKKMNDEKELKKAADEKLQKKMNDEKLKKSADEKLQKKMNDEKEIKKKPEEKIQKKVSEEKVQKIDLKALVAPKLVAMKTATLVQSSSIQKKEEKKIEKKEEKIQKAEQKKDVQPIAVVAPRIVSLKEEKKLEKKEDKKIEKTEEKIQKAEQKKDVQPMAVAAPRIVSLKEEKKLEKKEDKKIEKTEEKMQKAEQKKDVQPMTVAAPRIVSLKEEKKLEKKEDKKIEKTEEKIQKAEQKKDVQPMTVAAPRIVSLKEEKKLDKSESPSMLQREAVEELDPDHAPEGFETKIAAAGEGRPLDRETRAWMENRFNVGFSQVRIHTDSTAARLCQEVGAHAFAYGAHIFFNTGKYNPSSEAGKFLLAHELTHVIQQGFADEPAQVQRTEEKKPQLKIDRLVDPVVQAKAAEPVVAKTANAQVQRAPIGVTAAPVSVQRGAFDRVRGGLAALAANIPGYSLITVIIGYNPILGQAVERNFTNILRGFMGLIPGGEILFQVLNSYQVVERIGTWVSQQLTAMGISSSMIRTAFDQFVESLGFSDVFSPGDVWERAKQIFTDPINRVKNFVAALITQAIAWLKEKFLKPIGDFAAQIPGYKLFKLIIGKDPFTNVAAPTTPISVIEAVAEFIPGGDEKVAQLKESKGLQKAYDWFMNETKVRNLTWARISATVGQIWDSLQLSDILSPIATIQRVGNIAAPLMTDLIGFAGACLMKLLEIIYEAVMGAGGAMVLSIIKKSQATFKTIIQNPVGFLGNLVRAVGMGIRQFSGNILRHLQTGVITWLTGTLTKAGVELPATWDLKGILKLILGILGITWPRIRGIAVEVFGAPVMTFLETAAGLVMDIKEKGFVQTIKDRVSEYFAGLKEMVLGKIKSFIQEKIVMAGITQLVSLLSPVGAVIQAIIKTYQTVMFFVQKINQILEFVNSIVDSIASIANGSLGAAAAYIEATMARTIPLLLDFLARMIGLGDISGKIKTTIESVQNFIAGKIRQGMMWVKAQVMKLIQMGKNAAGRLAGWLGLKKPFTTVGGQAHTVLFKKQGAGGQLMIHSTEMAMETFVAGLVSKYASDPAKSGKAAQAAQLVAKIKEKTASPTPESALAADKQDPKVDSIVSGLVDQLTVILQDIGDGVDLTKAVDGYRGLHWWIDKSKSPADQDKKYLEQVSKTMLGMTQLSDAATAILSATTPAGTTNSESSVIAASDIVKGKLNILKDGNAYTTEGKTYTDKFHFLLGRFVTNLNAVKARMRDLGDYQQLQQELNGLNSQLSALTPKSREHYAKLNEIKKKKEEMKNSPGSSVPSAYGDMQPEITANPFISTSLNATKAAEYSLGTQHKPAGMEQRKAGKVGRVQIFVASVKELVAEGTYSIDDLSKTTGKIKIRKNFSESEITFAGSIPGNFMKGVLDVQAGESAGDIGSRAKGRAATAAAAFGGLK